MNNLNDIINLANALPDAAIEPAAVRSVKVYNHPDPEHPGRLLPVKRRVSKREERGGLSARQAKKLRMADLKEYSKELRAKLDEAEAHDDQV